LRDVELKRKVLMNISQNPQDRKLTEVEKTARAELNRAVSLHLQGNKAGAMKAIRHALMLDPTLDQEKLTLNLAKELTALPAQEAMALLANADASKTMMESTRKEDRQVSKAKPLNISVYLLVLLVVVLVGMVGFGLAFGKFNSVVESVNVVQQETHKYKSGKYDYYLFVPDGSTPEGGWPVVVALHGLGGQGGDMIWMAENFTNAGVIFIAPTYFDYQPYPGDGPIEPLSQLLKEIGAKYPIQSRGAVLLGLSQGGTFAFRFSLRHPEQIYGVVTAGAPEYDQVFPVSSKMSYIFTWGASDGLQDYVIPGHVKPLKDAGYNITTYIIPGYGHEVSPFAIEQTLNMIR
jgi:predicted esterase